MNDTSTIKENKTDSKARHVPLYKCLLHNDDYNVMKRVASVLCKVFGFNWNESVQIMIEAHNTGVALCKVEVFEQAEFHSEQLNSYGLISTIEPA